MAKAISKPLSFSTTIRNPHRIADFLFCLKKFNEMILTDEIIHKIVKEVLKRKIYYTMPEIRDPELFEIYSGDGEFTDEQLERIISISPQKHKEAGFDYGWPSRFDTWYELLREFGFVSYSMNNKICLSESGLLMANSVINAPANYHQWEYNEDSIQSAMLNSMVKYQIDNPFCKNANKNNPLILLLRTIEILKKKITYNGISRSEISLLICWPNNDADKLANYILSFRKKHGFSASDEEVYDCCLSLLGVGREKEKRFKMSQITGEAVDEYIRKMRITGIISLRGNGRFIDENEFEREKIDYILNTYVKYVDFTNMSNKEYFDYMGSLDTNLIFKPEAVHPGLYEARKRALKTYSELYDDAKIVDELDITCTKRNSHDDMLKLIDKPTRFEFLISVLLCKRYGVDVVSPNYDVDDEGLPKHTAGGGEPDIICQDLNTIALVEVSLMLGRSDQINNEVVPIQRHLKCYENPLSKDKNAIFVAPKIHSDTKLACRYARLLDKINIFAYDCSHFQKQVNATTSLTELCKLMQNDSLVEHV